MEPIETECEDTVLKEIETNEETNDEGTRILRTKQLEVKHKVNILNILLVKNTLEILRLLKILSLRKLLLNMTKIQSINSITKHIMILKMKMITLYKNVITI